MENRENSEDERNWSLQTILCEMVALAEEI